MTTTITPAPARMEADVNPLIGKVVTAVWLAKDRQAVAFDFGDQQLVAKVDGDCCSLTWIENIDNPEALIGATVTAVESIEMPDLGNVGTPHQPSVDEVSYYGERITSTKGICVIDYRNDSNGYYGGSLSWPGDSYYYGGVHGQNVSAEEWQRIA